MTDLAHELHAILAAERQALLGGRYDRLAQLSARKGVAFSAMTGATLPPAQIGAIAAAAARNQAMLQAALSGFRQTSDAASPTFRLYGSAGANLQPQPATAPVRRW